MFLHIQKTLDMVSKRHRVCLKNWQPREEKALRCFTEYAFSANQTFLNPYEEKFFHSNKILDNQKYSFAKNEH
ncbi:MAG TPA: hypothetical protein DCP61_05320 [Treponema sp.]|nr:hypothetical protein [Treponema sp.]